MIVKDDIKKIAELAMIEIKDDDIDKFSMQFNAILDYMKEMDTLDLSNQEAAFHITEMKNVFREDTVHNSLDNDTATLNAPEESEGFFKVPKVI